MKKKKRVKKTYMTYGNTPKEQILDQLIVQNYKSKRRMQRVYLKK